MWYFIGWSLFLLFFKVYLGFKVVGREHIPKKGAFIFVSNHVSYFDPILLGTALHRSLNYMARADLFKGFLGWALPKVHAFPVARGNGDLAAIRESLRMLNTGRPLVIFPEGTRSYDKTLRPAKPGVGFIVAKSGVPVVPAYIDGSFEALPKGASTLKRHPVSVYIGEPINFNTAYFDRRNKEVYQRMSVEVMKHIAELKAKYVDKAG